MTKRINIRSLCNFCISLAVAISDLGNKAIKNIFSFFVTLHTNPVGSSSIYLALIPVYAFIYLLFSSHFYHNTIRLDGTIDRSLLEASFKLEQHLLTKSRWRDASILVTPIGANPINFHIKIGSLPRSKLSFISDDELFEARRLDSAQPTMSQRDADLKNLDILFIGCTFVVSLETAEIQSYRKPIRADIGLRRGRGEHESSYEVKGVIKKFTMSQVYFEEGGFTSYRHFSSSSDEGELEKESSWCVQAWNSNFGGGILAGFEELNLPTSLTLYGLDSDENIMKLYNEFHFIDAASEGKIIGSLRDYWTFFYLSTVTITTLGFGDIVPTSTTSRLFVASESIIGIILIGLFLNGISKTRYPYQIFCYRL